MDNIYKLSELYMFRWMQQRKSLDILYKIIIIKDKSKVNWNKAKNKETVRVY